MRFFQMFVPAVCALFLINYAVIILHVRFLQQSSHFTYLSTWSQTDFSCKTCQCFFFIKTCCSPSQIKICEFIPQPHQFLLKLILLIFFRSVLALNYFKVVFIKNFKVRKWSLAVLLERKCKYAWCFYYVC